MRNLKNCALILLAFFVLMCGCNKDDGKTEGRDFGDTPVFNDFSPKEGRVRTSLFITGKNFGKDISKIEVFVGDKKLKVIGSDGQKIYCSVPRYLASGKVKVIVNNGNPVEHIFDTEFHYLPTLSVGTLLGKVDELGNSSIVDGTFDEAGFGNPMWVLFEPQSNSLFVVETEKAVRKVDINERSVKTLITNGQASFKKIQTISLSFNNDSLFLVDDNGQSNKNQVAIAYTLRSENYRRVHPYIYDRTSYACASHPTHNIMFFNTYWGGGIQKAFPDPLTGILTSKELFKVGGNNNIKPNIFFHPTGNYAYFMIGNCIWKSQYNWTTQELEFPIMFAGQYNVAGDVDAIGTSARFGYLRQGVFVKNPNYAGQPDEYDFYACDINNHSIRIISPTGEVNTFAGKGSPSTDNKKEGYIDGDLRLEARFNKPSGIAYDAERKIFYISEEINKRIRTISIE
ncbi:IPT/TIG domain-containing protein [Sphingobacterium multivorum]|uniref:IPT/TIG domain-containing protein n=1 Tax=Sphingobacterium multivorum TaxID=28454 RepID=UPI003DA4A87E